MTEHRYVEVLVLGKVVSSLFEVPLITAKKEQVLRKLTGISVTFTGITLKKECEIWV